MRKLKLHHIQIYLVLLYQMIFVEKMFWIAFKNYYLKKPLEIIREIKIFFSKQHANV